MGEAAAASAFAPNGRDESERRRWSPVQQQGSCTAQGGEEERRRGGGSTTSTGAHDRAEEPGLLWAWHSEFDDRSPEKACDTNEACKGGVGTYMTERTVRRSAGRIDQSQRREERGEDRGGASGRRKERGDVRLGRRRVGGATHRGSASLEWRER